MPDTPNQGESLSALRRRGAVSRWSKQVETALPAIATPPPAPAKKAAAKKATAPAWTADKATRISEITADAMAAYNTILAKPAGKLQRVTNVGVERRRKEVARVVLIASRMCEQFYGDKRVTPQFWEQYFGEVERDPFRSGKKQGGPGHEDWKPGFEYLTRERTMIDVFEGAVTRLTNRDG